MTTINPATEEPAGSAPDAGAEDVDAAVRAARAAFRESGWAQLPPKERARYPRALADEFEKHNEALGELVTMENGMATCVSPREEIFGPVLAVIRYDNEDEAIAIANDSEYGLGGVKGSGIGRENGPEGLEEYTTTKSIARQA